jgi:NAD(P)-dependent dehydrogenase (short-subunit alcohol dehydrogenase family)
MRLGGRVALVTGAQQGIGRAIAIALGRDGANVCVNFLDDRGAAEGVVAEIRSQAARRDHAGDAPTRTSRPSGAAATAALAPKSSSTT